ncbi:MAG: T9SS type A sorting domain-containing protein [Spirochaetes bacterium]|nr:T9SS type A sorting domain-containing protein [Spirochaetota bacterium]
MKIKRLLFTILILLSSFNLYGATFYNYPNPFNEKTNFKLKLDKEAKKIELKIYNEDGQKVWSYLKENLVTVNIQWNGMNSKTELLKSGIYLARLFIEYKSGQKEKKVIKVVLLR